MATDGQNNDENGVPPGGNAPPWMKRKKKPSDQKTSARKNAIQERLAKMSGKKS